VSVRAVPDRPASSKPSCSPRAPHGGPRGDRRGLTLSCEFDRERPGEAGSYVVVVEFEGRVGAGGLAGAAVSMDGSVRQIAVAPQH
jgi:hypothetical protein